MSEIVSLLRRAKNGDENALGELFSQYKSQLRKMIAFRMDQNLKGRVDPSDVLQEAYLDLAKRLPEFEGKGVSFFVWLRLVTRESLINVHRRHLDVQKRDPRKEVSLHQRETNGTSISLAAHLMGNQTSIVGKAIRSEQKTHLMAVLDEMDVTDREIIALRIFEGLTNGEASAVLGLTKQTTSKRFIRAIERLKDWLTDIPGFADF